MFNKLHYDIAKQRFLHWRNTSTIDYISSIVKLHTFSAAIAGVTPGEVYIGTSEKERRKLVDHYSSNVQEF